MDDQQQQAQDLQEQEERLFRALENIGNCAFSAGYNVEADIHLLASALGIQQHFQHQAKAA